MTSRAAVLVLAIALLGACSGRNEEEPSITVGTLPAETTPTTLLPVLTDTVPPDDTNTLAPDTMFGGDLCTALEARDFTGTVIDGLGSGTLRQTSDVAEDACAYTVRAGGKDHSVVVAATSEVDFGAPTATDEEAEDISGIGLAAVGVAHGDDTYEVFVKVDNGFFSVTSPDSSSARALAKAAARRA